MSGSTLNVCFVGAGFIAEYHARALRRVKGARLAGVCDASAARAQAFARKWSVPAAYSDLQQMLAEQKPQVVHVLTPPDQHCAAALAAIDAGAHVLLEKPMCVSEEEAQRVTARADARGVCVGVNHNLLFFEAYEDLRRDVRTGRLGPLNHVVLAHHADLAAIKSGPWDAWMLRKPGNIVLELGSHAISAVLDLVGAPAVGYVEASMPVVLPPGGRFYRRWLVSAHAGASVVEVSFLFAPGLCDRYVRVRGAVGVGIADIEADAYVLDRRTVWSDDIDRYVRTRRTGARMRRRAGSALLEYVRSKLGLGGGGNPFESSIVRSVGTFYRGIAEARLDERLSGQRGLETVRWCCRIIERSSVEEESRSVSTAAATGSGRPAILIIGGTGFVGRSLVRRFLKADRPVRLLVRRPGSLPKELVDPRIDICAGDILNPDDIRKALAGVELVYHLARAQAKTWEEYERLDVEPTRVLGELSAERGVRRLVYTGSIDSLYTGARAGVITDDTPVDARIHRRNNYARAKAAGEAALMDIHRRAGLPVVIIRPGIVIGRGGNVWHWGVGMWLGPGVCRVWGAGCNKLPLVLVDDVAEALLRAGEVPGIEGRAYNIVGEPCLSAREYLEEIERHGGLEIQKYFVPPWRFYLVDMFKWVVKVVVGHPERRMPAYRDWESRTQRATFDCSGARRDLNWQPVRDRAILIAEGIHAPLDEWLA